MNGGSYRQDGSSRQNPRPFQHHVRIYDEGYPLHEIQRIAAQQRRSSQHSMPSPSLQSERSPPFERYRDDAEEKWRDSSTVSDGDWSTEDDERRYSMDKEKSFQARRTSKYYKAQISIYDRPLIHNIRNDWRTDSKNNHRGPHDTYDDDVFGPGDCLEFLSTKKVRRILGFFLVSFVLFWLSWFTYLGPRFNEHLLLKGSLDPRLSKLNGMFGANIRPEFADMVQLRMLDSRLVPVAGRQNGNRRLIVVGDVHGCKEELLALLAKVSYDKTTDHLILAGDLIAKGPDSPAIVSLALSLNASCVRGNHEDRVLLAYRDLSARRPTYPSNLPSAARTPKAYQPHPNQPSDLDNNQFPHGDAIDRGLAKSFSEAEIAYLAACPVILRVGQLRGMGDVAVVHAGLVPGVDLERQDPSAVMSMRSIDLDTHVPSRDSEEGVPWTKLWNKYQGMQSSKARSTVLYGHDSKRGLVLEKWSKGLDTGCVKGGRLTAMVLETAGGWTGEVANRVVSVGCRDYRPRDLGYLGQG